MIEDAFNGAEADSNVSTRPTLAGSRACARGSVAAGAGLTWDATCGSVEWAAKVMTPSRNAADTNAAERRNIAGFLNG
jgi:hypothetical protein